MNSLKMGYESIGVCAYGLGFSPPPPPGTHHRIQIFVKMVKLLDALKHLLRSYKYFLKLIFFLFIFVQKLFAFKVGVCEILRSTCIKEALLPVLSYQSCV